MSPYTLSDSELLALLQDDTPCGDATTWGLGIGEQHGRIDFHARYPMCLCGSEEAVRLGELAGLSPCTPRRASGEMLAAGELILGLCGPAAALHRVWKTAQTLMEYLSGIASAAATLLEAGRSADPQASLVCTRKHFPGGKAAALKAVLAAGASPHRISLSETLLVFAEHRAFLHESPSASLARLRLTWPERPVIVEVADLTTALAWAEAGADILQLEKLPPAQVAELQALLQARLPQPPRLAAAGGVTPANAAAYVRAGARILVSSAPYFAPPKDVAVQLYPL